MSRVTTVGEAKRELAARKQSYQLVSNQPAGQAVLADLARVCHAYETCFDPNDRVQAWKEGQRSVWLHIQSQLKLTDDQLYIIATGGMVPLDTTEDEL